MLFRYSDDDVTSEINNNDHFQIKSCIFKQYFDR